MAHGKPTVAALLKALHRDYRDLYKGCLMPNMEMIILERVHPGPECDFPRGQTVLRRRFYWNRSTDELYADAGMALWEPNNRVGCVIKRRLHVFVLQGPLASIPEVWFRVG